MLHHGGGPEVDIIAKPGELRVPGEGLPCDIRSSLRKRVDAEEPVRGLTIGLYLDAAAQQFLRIAQPAHQGVEGAEILYQDDVERIDLEGLFHETRRLFVLAERRVDD